MNNKNRLFVMLALLLLLAGDLYASNNIEAVAYIENSNIKPGDIARLVVEVTANSGVNLEIPDMSKELIAGLPVADSGVEGPAESNGQIYLKLWYKLAPSKSGSYLIDPIVINYIIDGDRKSLDTEPLYLNVKGEGELEQLRPLKPLDIPEKRLPDWFILAAILVVLCIIVAIIRFYLKSGKKKIRGPQISPRDKGLAALSQIRMDQLASPYETRRFCFKISEIVRRFVEEEHKVMALEETSHEILVSNKLQFIVGREQFGNLKVFLNMTDQVKFAQYNPSVEEIENVYSLAVGVVQFVGNIDSAAERENFSG